MPETSHAMVNSNINEATEPGAGAALPEELICMSYGSNLGTLKQSKITFRLGISNLVKELFAKMTRKQLL